MKPFFVYLLRCGDRSYYCGHTDDLDIRMHQHSNGVIGYTAGRKPLTLVWQAVCEQRVEALALERQIKGWSRAKKEALIAGDWTRISQLSKSKSSDALRQAQGERCVDR